MIFGVYHDSIRMVRMIAFVHYSNMSITLQVLKSSIRLFKTFIQLVRPLLTGDAA